MKTFVSRLTMLFVALALVFTACEKAPVEEQKPDPQPEVELMITSGTQEVVSPEGGEVVITYTLNGESDMLPEAECEAEWISDIAVAEGTITLNVAENEDEVYRQAWVKITFNSKEQSVEIMQEPNVPWDIPPQTEYEYTMATAERDAKYADPDFSIVFASEDGKTRLVAHFVEVMGNWLLEGSEYSSQSGTIDLAKTMFKNEGGIVKLTDAVAEVSYIGTDDVPPSTRRYTFRITLTDTDDIKHIVTYQGEVTNIYQGPTGPETFMPTKVVAVKSMIGNFFLQLYIDDSRYHELDLLDETAPNDKYLSEGVYKFSDNNIGHTNSTFNIEGDIRALASSCGAEVAVDSTIPYGKVRVVTHSDIYDIIEIKAEESTLEIGLKPGEHLRADTFEVYVPAYDYNTLAISSGSSFEWEGCSVETLTIAISAGADAEISGTCTTLTLAASSGADADLVAEITRRVMAALGK